MKGFDGDPEKAAALREALVELVAVFPAHLVKSANPSWDEPETIVRQRQFDAIVRAHKHDRLAMPIQALREIVGGYHGFDYVHPRRLAYFVPSLLASWLDRAPGPYGRRFGSSDIEDIAQGATWADQRVDLEPGEWEWTEEEATALASFFELALDASLASPLGPPQKSDIPRPLEDGVQVWSVVGPSVPLDVLRVAKALKTDIEPLVVRWALDESPLALEHLLEAVYDPNVASKHYLSHELVANRLYEAFFDATGERALRLSKAEATVRRNIVRREDA